MGRVDPQYIPNEPRCCTCDGPATLESDPDGQRGVFCDGCDRLEGDCTCEDEEEVHDE